MSRTPDAYAVGVDVGRTRDRSAITVLHRHGPTGEVFVRYAQFRAGMSLEELEAAALSVLVSLDRQIPRDAKLMLAIDRNGIGMGPAEAIHRRVVKEKSVGLRRYVKVVGVDATGGTSANRDEKVKWWWNVGRDLLTHRTNAALRDGTLNIREAEGNGADVLGEEVSRLHLKVKPSGRQRVDHRDGEHDDLYMSMCLAFWLLGEFPIGGTIPTSIAPLAHRMTEGPPPRSPKRSGGTTLASPDMVDPGDDDEGLDTEFDARVAAERARHEAVDAAILALGWAETMHYSEIGRRVGLTPMEAYDALRRLRWDGRVERDAAFADRWRIVAP